MKASRYTIHIIELCDLENSLDYRVDSTMFTCMLHTIFEHHLCHTQLIISIGSNVSDPR
jgi:hypothetical protein